MPVATKSINGIVFNTYISENKAWTEGARRKARQTLDAKRRLNRKRQEMSGREGLDIAYGAVQGASLGGMLGGPAGKIVGGLLGGLASSSPATQRKLGKTIRKNVKRVVR